MQILNEIKKKLPDVLIFSIVQHIDGTLVDLDFIKKIKNEFPEILIIADGTQFCGTKFFDFKNSNIDILISSVYWENADDFWDTYDVTWGSGQTPVTITDNGNTNQKIQYLIITDTEDLNDGDTVTISSDSTDYPDDVIITLRKVCEPKFTPLSVIFYNKYGALQNLWFFKKSMTDISISSNKFKNNIIDFDNSGGSPSYSLSKHQEKIFMSNGKESITMNTGFYDESFNDIIRQLLLSEQVWVYDGTNTLPINLKSNTLLFKKGVNDKLISYTISFDYAYDKINNIQ